MKKAAVVAEGYTKMNFFVKNKKVAPLILRIGFFMTLLFSVIFMKFGETESVAGVWNKVGLGWLGGTTSVLVVGVILAILALMILIGYYPRTAAGFLVIFFVVIIVTTFSTEIFDKVKVWKDFTLLGVALYFLFAGTEPYSIH